MNANLATLLDHNVGRYPDKVVLRHGDRELTNRELHRRVDAVAAGLAARRIGRGDVVALLMFNRTEFVESLLAVSKLGAVFLPLNYRLSPHEWAYILDHAGARLVVTEDDLLPALDKVPEAPDLIVVGDAYESLVSAHDGAGLSTVDSAMDDLQRLMYTSGTTSRPKGVRITHGNVLWKIVGHLVEFGITGADHTLVCGPLYHVGGLDLPGLGTLYAGGELTLLRVFEADAVVDAIERVRPTNVWLAPAMMNAVLNVDGLSTRDLSSIRFIIGGGEKMPEPVVHRIVDAFPNAWFSDAYGLTETVSGDTFNDREHALSKIGSVGRPVMHLQVRVVDEADQFMPAGTVGEIVLRGPKVSAGYWKDEEATMRAMRGGWFHTGDMGRLDEDGYLFVEDRKKDMIISGGENIATPEVERVLYEHDAVLEAAVIGLPHERWGEVPQAFVVLREGQAADAEGLTAFCRDRLAKFKVPARVTFLPELPRNPSGKVLKRQLRDG